MVWFILNLSLFEMNKGSEDRRWVKFDYMFLDVFGRLWFFKWFKKYIKFKNWEDFWFWRSVGKRLNFSFKKRFGNVRNSVDWD